MLEPLLDCDLLDIAEIIGWTDMKAVAIRSGMRDTTIENCRLNHVGEAQEQTLELLKEFVNKEGNQAQTTLIKTLQNSGKRGIAERVIAKLNLKASSRNMNVAIASEHSSGSSSIARQEDLSA